MMRYRSEKLEKIREIFKDKAYPSAIWVELENLKIMHGKLDDDEIRELGYLLRDWVINIKHPLAELLRAGYRYYSNTKQWDCHFCGRKIKVGERYWAHKMMEWSQGPKLCHECFLKLLAMIDYNSRLYELLEAFKSVDRLHGADRVILLDRMKSTDFLLLITGLARYYDDFVELKGKNESEFEYIQRIIKIVKQFDLTEQIINTLSELANILKHQSKLLEEILNKLNKD